MADHTEIVNPLNRTIGNFRDRCHQRAAQVWQARFAGRVDADYLGRLAREWRHAAGRRQTADWAQACFAIFCLLAELDQGARPRRSAIRFYLRSLRTFPFASAWRLWTDTLRGAGDASVALRRWRDIHGGLQREQAERLLHAARFAELSGELSRLMAFFLPRQRLPNLAPVSGDEAKGITAWTDGQSIRLPAVVSISPTRAVNEWYYVILLAHEAEHLAIGSLHFSFRSPLGSNIWERLAPRRDTFRCARSRWDGEEVLERISMTQMVPKGFRPHFPHLAAVFAHFENPKAIHRLFNLIEDVRVDQSLVRRYPGLVGMDELCHLAGRRLATAPQALSAAANFEHALVECAHGLPADAYVADRYRTAYQRAEALLRNWRDEANKSVAKAIWQALDLHDILAKHLPRTDFDRLLQWLESRIKVSADEQGLRYAAMRSSGSEELSAAEGRRIKYRGDDECEPSRPGPWLRYDEKNGWTSSLEKGVVRLRCRPWQARRSPAARPDPLVADSLMPLPAIHGKERCRQRRYESEGVCLDTERWHASSAMRLAGVTAEGLFFVRPRRRRQPLAVSILVDLSVSMEMINSTRRERLVLPQATGIAQALAASFTRHGFPTAVYGLHDFGRRHATLYEIKSTTAPYSEAVFKTIHTMCVGGFRAGAGIRHLDRMASVSHPGYRHLLVMITDTGSHYLSTGNEKMMVRHFENRCPPCTHPCVVEPCVLSSNIHQGPFNYYYPAAYELADMQHAVAHADCTTPLLVLLGNDYSDRALDHYLGRHHWMRFLGAHHLPLLMRNINRLLDRNWKRGG